MKALTLWQPWASLVALGEKRIETRSWSTPFNATQTARAAIATATSDAHRWQTTATAERRTLEAEQARAQATATAQAFDLQTKQDQQTRDALIPLLVLVAALIIIAFAAAVIWFMFYSTAALVQIVSATAARQLVIETRAGTVMLTRTKRGTYTPSLVTTDGYAALPAGETDDAFEASQAHAVENESVDMLKVTTSRGATFIARDDPQEQQRETNRKLTMRLLRESIKYCHTNGIDPRTTNQIPSFRELGWSSESWVRAVAILKAARLATTQQGRGGGTYCADAYPTLTQLYAAIGERRAPLAEHQAPSPIAGEVAA